MNIFKKYQYDMDISKEQNIKNAKSAYWITSIIGIVLLLIGTPICAYAFFETNNTPLILASAFNVLLGVYFIVIGQKNGYLVNEISPHKGLRASDICWTLHYTGLPKLQDNQAVYITTLNDRIIFSDKFDRTGINSVLYLNKIKHTARLTTTELVNLTKKENVILGAALWGLPGAVLGSMIKESEYRVFPLYMIIYISDGEEKVVILRESDKLPFRQFQKFLDSKTTPMDDIIL